MSNMIDKNVRVVRSRVDRFAIYGVLIAVTAAILATIATDLFSNGSISLQGFIEVQKTNPGLWLLDLLPFIFAFWGQKVGSAVQEDVTEFVKVQANEFIQQTANLEKQAMHEATHDSLTNLPNRMLLRDRFSQAALVATKLENSIALLMLDVDQFKEINDVLGHENGDRLLKMIATRLKEVVRTTDSLCRLGGDEFAVVATDIDDSDSLQAICETLQDAFLEPFNLNKMDLEVRVTIGGAVFPEHGGDFDTLFQKSEVAMYVAKDSKLKINIYDPKQEQGSTKRLSLLAQMRHALTNNEMELHYQGKVDARSQKPKSVEALIRWNHPSFGMVPPDEFIHLAEQSGLIVELTQWILRTAATKASKWNREGIDLNISVNLSPTSLLDTDFPDFMAGLLAKHSLKGSALTMEITESTLVRNPDLAFGVLNRLSKMGLAISIDDFGTGYSSLAYLKNIPANELKIDQAFVKTMLEDSSDMAIVKSTIDLAHNLGMEVVAEGVEDEETALKLRDLGCDVLQGFHFSRPLTADKLEIWYAASLEKD